MHHDMRISQVTEVVNRNSTMVYRLAFSMVKTIQDAEDIHQEVFIQYIRKTPEFESLQHEKAWFIKVTTNLCKNLWKSAWRQKMVSMEQIEPDEAEGREAFTEEEERVLESVMRLPAKYRVVIHLFYYEEMSVEEIATALSLQPSNVRTRLTRGRRILGKWLKEEL